MENNWILPEVQKDIDALKQEELVKKQNLEDCRFLESDLHPNYVLIDAALWGTEINILLLDENATYKSLFRGSTGEKLWSVAPYLVDISSNEELVKKIREKDAIEHRVTWLSSSLNIDELRKHLRRFLRMKTEKQRYFYFRFYDPYVADSIFPNLNQVQYSEFFGKIDYMVIDDIRINERHILYLSCEKTLQIKQQTLELCGQ